MYSLGSFVVGTFECVPLNAAYTGPVRWISFSRGNFFEAIKEATVLFEMTTPTSLPPPPVAAAAAAPDMQTFVATIKYNVDR